MNNSPEAKDVCDGRIDVRAFGVQADGEHDDAPALQAAIDAVPDAGGKVLLPSGRMRCSHSLRINRPYITIEGVNCGLRSKLFEPEHQVGIGSLLAFDADCDGIVVMPPPQPPDRKLPRLGGITLREFGIAGTGKKNGHRAILVDRGKDWRWGSTDALLLERLYTIEYEWSAELNFADATIVTGCWFSECGNGLKLNGCVYNAVTNCCFADNDGVGVIIEDGISHELTACLFVRLERALEIDKAQRIRVNGNCFEACGAERDDKSFIRIRNEASAVVTGAVFHSGNQQFEVGVDTDESSSAEVVGCMVSGKIARLI